MTHENLSPTVRRMREVCEAVHELKMRGTLTFQRVELPADPVELENTLKQERFGSIMLQDGESFSIDDPSGYFPPLDLEAGEVDPCMVTATAWIWDYKEQGFGCQLDTELWYEKGDLSASQRVTMYAGSSYDLPRISRALGSFAYAETGYEGHGFATFEDTTEQDCAALLDIVEPLVTNGVRLEQQRRMAASGSS